MLVTPTAVYVYSLMTLTELLVQAPANLEPPVNFTTPLLHPGCPPAPAHTVSQTASLLPPHDHLLFESSAHLRDVF